MTPPPPPRYKHDPPPPTSVVLWGSFYTLYLHFSFIPLFLEPRFHPTPQLSLLSTCKERNTPHPHPPSRTWLARYTPSPSFPFFPLPPPPSRTWLAHHTPLPPLTPTPSLPPSLFSALSARAFLIISLRRVPILFLSYLAPVLFTPSLSPGRRPGGRRQAQSELIRPRTGQTSDVYQLTAEGNRGRGF